MQELQNTLASDEDLTVIGAEAFQSENIIPESRDDVNEKKPAAAMAKAGDDEFRPSSSHSECSVNSFKKVNAISPTNNNTTSSHAACVTPPSIYTDIMDLGQVVEWFRGLYSG